jgi:hypothetical protein
VLFFASLHFHDTPQAENMLAIQLNWSICDREANRTQVIVQLGDNADQLLRHLSADVLGNIASQKFFGRNHNWECFGDAQGSALVKLFGKSVASLLKDCTS